MRTCPQFDCAEPISDEGLNFCPICGAGLRLGGDPDSLSAPPITLGEDVLGRLAPTTAAQASPMPTPLGELGEATPPTSNLGRAPSGSDAVRGLVSGGGGGFLGTTEATTPQALGDRMDPLAGSSMGSPSGSPSASGTASGTAPGTASGMGGSIPSAAHEALRFPDPLPMPGLAPIPGVPPMPSFGPARTPASASSLEPTPGDDAYAAIGGYGVQAQRSPVQPNTMPSLTDGRGLARHGEVYYSRPMPIGRLGRADRFGH